MGLTIIIFISFTAFSFLLAVALSIMLKIELSEAIISIVLLIIVWIGYQFIYFAIKDKETKVSNEKFETVILEIKKFNEKEASLNIERFYERR